MQDRVYFTEMQINVKKIKALVKKAANVEIVKILKQRLRLNSM